MHRLWPSTGLKAGVNKTARWDTRWITRQRVCEYKSAARCDS